MSRPTRLATLDDVPLLVELLRTNRNFLAPWESARDDASFAIAGQHEVIRAALERHEHGTCVPHVILDEAGRVVGLITLDGIVRGAFQSCSLSYWLGAVDSRQSLASGAVQEIMRVAFDELGLHRIQAKPLLQDVASQRVLERNGFVRVQQAPVYICVDGEWRDHLMYEAWK